jgi:hypothetical protein
MTLTSIEGDSYRRQIVSKRLFAPMVPADAIIASAVDKVEDREFLIANLTDHHRSA